MPQEKPGHLRAAMRPPPRGIAPRIDLSLCCPREKVYNKRFDNGVGMRRSDGCSNQDR